LVSSSSSLLLSLLPSSEDESQGRLNKNPEWELFFRQTTLLQDAILAKDNCGCEQDMTWKNQQMEMKNKGMPEQDGKGKWSRETWRVRVNHGK
jgi:hypothetical protein